MSKRRSDGLVAALRAMEARLARLEQQAELMKTVLMVREPGSALAADAYEGLRKQVIAASGERRAHLAQLTQMAVAASRAHHLDDVRRQVNEWLSQSGVVEVRAAPRDRPASELFEFSDGGPAGATEIECLEPAYVDGQTGMTLRLGRARALPAAVTTPGSAREEER